MIENLTDLEKSALKKIVRSTNRLFARRAAIILLSSQEASSTAIADAVKVAPQIVQHWQQEFKQKRLGIFPDLILDSDSGVVRKGETATPEPAAAQAALPPTPPLIKSTAKPLKPKRRKLIHYPVRKRIGLKPTDSMSEAGRKVLGFHFAHMLKHEPGTRLGEDIEELHDMRVATRRMRAAFDLFGQAFSKKKIKPFRRGLKKTAQALGPARDLDVFMARLQHYQQTLPEDERTGIDPLLNTWRTQQNSARKKMLAFLDSKEYLKFKQDALDFLETKRLATKSTSTRGPVPYQLRHLLPRLIYISYEKVAAYETILENAALDTLHSLRLEFKQFRYTLEFFREILGQEQEAIVGEVKKIQDHLGNLNDADVASGILRDFLENWEEHQLHLPLAERQSPIQVVAYLNTNLEERHRLIVSFPEAWAHFSRPEFRRNLALAVAGI